MPQILIAATPQARSSAERLQALLLTVPEMRVFISEESQAAQRADALLIVVGADGINAIVEDAALGETVEAGLGRGDLLALVVLMDGASIPDMMTLPEGLRALSYTGKVTLQEASFDRDASLLYSQLNDHFQRVSTASEPTRNVEQSDTSTRRPLPWNVIILGVVVLVAIVLVTVSNFNNRSANLPTASGAESTAAPISLPSREVVLGVGASFSDDPANGEAMLRGVQLALEDRPTLVINNITYVVDLLSQDAGCSAFAGLQTAELFTADPSVVGIIGHQCNPSCSAAASVYERTNVTTISPGCDDPALTQNDTTGFNRVVPSAAYPAVAAARYASDSLDFDRAAVVYDELLRGGEFAGSFAAEFGDSDGTVTGFFGIDSSTADYADLVSLIMADTPQMIFVAGRPETAALLRAQLPPDIAFFYGGGGAIETDAAAFIELAGDTSEGVMTFIALPLTNDAVDRLAERYAQAYNVAPPSPVFAYAYDAANLLMNAIESTARVDPNGNLRVDPVRVAAYVRTYQGTGVTGALACDDQGDCATARVSVRVVQNGASTEITILAP
ncbi:MAG: branched-chain amino acid ABC transporter substrate-binding protein [Chitinophagaceae bacterium]|nr:branched-chain amino acid ABC transporter substrate-binding protein [Anaerolineae bacterium]